MKFLESRGIPRKTIIDGRVFQIPHFNFPRLLAEGIAYGIIDVNNFSVNSHTTYPQILISSQNSVMMTFGIKSYVSSHTAVEGNGSINIGNYSSLSWNITFNMLGKEDHDYRRVSTFPLGLGDCGVPSEFYQPYLNKPSRKILIGSDVWIGRGCILKSTNPDKPLIIGDGAVVASDSVVVKNVPPYAIVGGNPAQIIKYRFPEKIIESLLRIKWWDWDLDKIHENFKYFNDVEKFVELHDKGV